MKYLGYLLITLGFLVGAYLTVTDVESVPWNYFGAALLVGVMGVALVQTSIRSRSRSRETIHSSIRKLDKALVEIVAKATNLDQEKESINVYDIHTRIDDLFMVDLDIFVENRESIGHAFGLQAYADVMTQFATGERYLNRCWSASTDGYVDEVNTYLTRAQEHFAEALKKLRTHKDR